MTSPTPSSTTTVTFVVEGMHCASCGILIDEVVEEVTGVATSATSVRRNQTVVSFDPARASAAEIQAAIAAAGSYDAKLVDGPAK